MAKQRKRVDPVKQREKRAKIAAAVGGVVFLIVCAIEIPSLMSSLNQQSPPPAAAATPAPASSAPPLANVAASPGAAAAPAPGTAELANTDVPPAPSDGSQLVSFSVFPTKDPFVPQLPAGSGQAGGPAGTTPTTTTPTTTTPTTTTPTTTTTTPTATTPAPTSTTPAPAPPVVSAVPSAPTTTTAAPQPTVAISVNGVVARVAQNGTFPSGSPVFRLVSWTKTTAQIGIVGGSYATGDPTLTVQLGAPLTLENQTDGKRYKLLLLSTPTP